MSHTPGPWILDSPAYGEMVDRDYHFIDAGCGYCGDGEDGFGLRGYMSLADARLIAAAPDLLEALKLVWAMFDDGRIVRNINNDGREDWALRMLDFTREVQSIGAAIAKAEGK